MENDRALNTWRRRSDDTSNRGTVPALSGVALVTVLLGTIPRAVDGAIVFVSAIFGGALQPVGLLMLFSLTIRDGTVPTVRDTVEEVD